jgi:hypothetical protein
MIKIMVKAVKVNAQTLLNREIAELGMYNAKSGVSGANGFRMNHDDVQEFTLDLMNDVAVELAKELESGLAIKERG